MDVVGLVRGHDRRLEAVEQELSALRDRVARLEGRRAERPAPEARRATRPEAPTEAQRQAPARPETPPRVREWLDPSGWPASAAPASPTPQRPAPASRPAGGAPAEPKPRPASPPSGAPTGPARPQAQPRPASPPRPAPEPRRPAFDLEELLGGRILGLAGAIAVLLGVAFLVAMAVDRGWVDEPTRIAIGFAGCGVLLLAGVGLYERRGRTQAALAAAGAAVAGLFATLTAGAQLYELFPVPVSLAIALGIGGIATALALRWNARTFAALGLLGALVAPILVGADQSDLTIGFVLLVLTIALAVGAHRAWGWLSLAASAGAVVQILDWVADGPDAPTAVIALSYFWAASVSAAAATERAARAKASSAVAAILALGAAVVVAPAGYYALDSLNLDDAANAWLFALAAAHAGLGLVAIAAAERGRISRDLAHMSIAAGIFLADVAFPLAVDGPALAIGWAASAAGLIALARARAADAGRLSLAAGAQIGLALLHALTVDADPTQLSERPDDLAGGIAALTAIGLGGLAAAQLLPRSLPVRACGHALAVAMLAYLTAFVLDGPAVAVAWAIEAVAVTALARLTKDGVDPVGALGAGALLGLALTHALTIDADPTQLAGPPHELLEGVASLGAVGLAALLGAQLLPRTGPGRAAGHAVTLLVLAYLSAFVLDGSLLALAWAVEAVAVLLLARSRDGGLDAVGTVGAVSLLGFALLHGLVLEAAPRALVYGVEDMADAAIALGALAGAAIAMSRLFPQNQRDERLGFASIGAAVLVYLGSVAIVTAFQPSGDGVEGTVGLLDERQQGQLLLSAFWAVTGVTALVVGLVRRSLAVRIGGFLLLGIATTKVFLFDLSTLESLYRVGSFVALGLLLLGAAFAWQRTRTLANGGGAPNGGEAGA